LSAYRVLARGDHEIPRVPAANDSDRNRGRRLDADRQEHQGSWPAHGDLDPELGPTAYARGLVCGADLRVGTVDGHGGQRLELAAWGRAAGLPRSPLERLGLRRDARGGASASIVCRRS